MNDRSISATRNVGQNSVSVDVARCRRRPIKSAVAKTWSTLRPGSRFASRRRYWSVGGGRNESATALAIRLFHYDERIFNKKKNKHSRSVLVSGLRLPKPVRQIQKKKNDSTATLSLAMITIIRSFFKARIIVRVKKNATKFHEGPLCFVERVDFFNEI